MGYAAALLIVTAAILVLEMSYPANHGTHLMVGLTLVLGATLLLGDGPAATALAGGAGLAVAVGAGGGRGPGPPPGPTRSSRARWDTSSCWRISSWESCSSW